jgi:hypothetical protein
MPKRSAAATRAGTGGGPTEHELPLRVTVVRPPPGVRLCLQRDGTDRIASTVSTGADITFDFTVRAKDAVAGGPPRLLGPVTHGPPDARFVYVCSGTLAGQPDSCWSRRAKVPLAGITRAMIRQVIGGHAARLEARFEGTGKDGGPSCATVPLTGGGWRPA